MLETSAPSALADWLGGRGSHSPGDHPLLVREKLEANYFDPWGASSCREKRHVLQRWRHMHEKFYRHRGHNVDAVEFYDDGGYDGLGGGIGGGGMSGGGNARRMMMMMGGGGDGLGGGGGMGGGMGGMDGYYGMGGRGGSRDVFKSDPEILVDFFFSKFADDGSDPNDDRQSVRE
jgi:hypothetical protein